MKFRLYYITKRIGQREIGAKWMIQMKNDGQRAVSRFYPFYSSIFKYLMREGFEYDQKTPYEASAYNQYLILELQDKVHLHWQESYFLFPECFMALFTRLYHVSYRHYATNTHKPHLPLGAHYIMVQSYGDDEILAHINHGEGSEMVSIAHHSAQLFKNLLAELEKPFVLPLRRITLHGDIVSFILQNCTMIPYVTPQKVEECYYHLIKHWPIKKWPFIKAGVEAKVPGFFL